jgi:hypothetical protein
MRKLKRVFILKKEREKESWESHKRWQNKNEQGKAKIPEKSAKSSKPNACSSWEGEGN